MRPYGIYLPLPIAPPHPKMQPMAHHNFLALFVATLAGLLCVLGVAVPARSADEIASELAAAQAAYVRGDFIYAAELARTAQSAAGHALAARSLLAHGDLLALPENRLEDFERAQADARKAIELDPDFFEGHLELAVALGLVGRQRGSLVAHLGGYASEARQHLDFILERDPDNVWANALLGGWHLEILYDGGALGAVLYGADAAEGLAHYRHALALEPDNGVIPYQFALQLFAAGSQAYEQEARTLLTRLFEGTPRNAVEMLTRERAARLLLAAESGRRDHIEDIINGHMGPGSAREDKSSAARHDPKPPIGLPK